MRRPNHVPAIETEYRGYRFRSRLEARVAAMLDFIGWEWEYEPEGFELASGRYLPDFALIKPQESLNPDCRVGERMLWIEVKGAPPTQKDLARAHDLAAATRTPVAFIVGMPRHLRLSGYMSWGCDCDKHSELHGAELHYGCNQTVWMDEIVHIGPHSFERLRAPTFNPHRLPDHVDAAAIRAMRRARFEFGEAPVV